MCVCLCVCVRAHIIAAMCIIKMNIISNMSNSGRLQDAQLVHITYKTKTMFTQSVCSKHRDQGLHFQSIVCLVLHILIHL